MSVEAAARHLVDVAGDDHAIHACGRLAKGELEGVRTGGQPGEDFLGALGLSPSHSGIQPPPSRPEGSLSMNTSRVQVLVAPSTRQPFHFSQGPRSMRTQNESVPLSKKVFRPQTWMSVRWGSWKSQRAKPRVMAARSSCLGTDGWLARPFTSRNSSWPVRGLVLSIDPTNSRGAVTLNTLLSLTSKNVPSTPAAFTFERTVVPPPVASTR